MRQPLEALIERYQRSLYAAAFNICRNPEDANDAVQDTFIQYYTSRKEFRDEEHLKAWLLRVAVNRAKDITRSFWRRNKISIEEYAVTKLVPNPIIPVVTFTDVGTKFKASFPV